MYTYDNVGNRTQLIYPDNKQVYYSYDGDNRLTTVLDWRGSTTSYDYDTVGRLITTTLPSSITTRVYDAANRLLSIMHKGTKSGFEEMKPFAYYQYELDNVGNRIGVSETLQGHSTDIRYGYDALYRLTNARYGGNITAEYEYYYDAVGNMIAHNETTGKETINITRSYNAANQLQTAMEAMAGTSSYYYDGNGNMVQVLPPGVNVGGEGEKLYDFNQRNLLIHHEENLGIFLGYPGFVDYVYDGNGDRVQQVVRETGYTPIITTTYTNDPLGLTQVLLADNGTTQTAQLYGLDLIGQDDIGQDNKEKAMRLLLTDGLGSVRQEMAGGVVQTTTTYSPYGNLLAQTGSSGTVYGYTGEQEDAATGLVYLRARYYNPNTNQFLTRDPYRGAATMPASQNGYSYVHGNPINYTDPTGYCIELVSGAICVGTGVIVVGTVAIVGGTVIVANNIVNDRPALDMSSLQGLIPEPPPEDSWIQKFNVLDDFERWVESFPLDEDLQIEIGTFPLPQLQKNIPTGFDLIEDSCWLEQFSPAPQIPRLPGFDLQPEIGPQILMATAHEILGELTEPGEGLVIRSGQLDANTLGQLTRETGDEFSLWIMNDGTKMLFRGQGDRGFVPEDGTRLIAHTHPGIKLSPSYDDYEVIKDSPQYSSAIVSENGKVYRWFKSWFEE